ncbi:helix-turn-helix domain-containing protein [Pseudoxanthomonas winnipegensis]|uniref:Helix-turn-helix domain-containing protein n=1 Tax=Pseudoxanthomonas winnipegensis TaxID=2480810 RepID=A0ABY1WCU2_9GAMM|nr:helix-turn-helix domain-containing protein [Pseudoxanthomonas winnipegensis]TAA12446.1 helix-turn-helix domain-containing protein [Pseudoxanthomonas winnipegensis]TAA19189.1 helix-turn-helix domain-containing protein [Pseudoxanthomonas winnipegensis]TAH70450.1 helix-turn-helix domain-containing protein [Pseudoxanthomonas winnipegensis]
MSIKLMQLVWDADVPASRKMVLLSLADQANDNGECYPRVSTIERRCSMGRRTVFQCLSDLEAEGFLTRTEMSGQRVLFRLDERLLRQLSLDVDGIEHSRALARSTGAKSAQVQDQHRCEGGTGAGDALTGAGAAPDRCGSGTGPVQDLHPYKATLIEPKGNPQEPSDPRGDARAPDDDAGQGGDLTPGRVVIALRRRHPSLRLNAMNPKLIAAVAAGTPLEHFIAMADLYPDKSGGYIVAAALSQFLEGSAPSPDSPPKAKAGGRGGRQTGAALQQSNRSVAEAWLEQQGDRQ